jgi:sulfotransferase family protein
MPLPNFLILGTAKAGTTALYEYLRPHPQVFMSTPKEPKFLAYAGKNPRFGGPGDREFNRRMVTKPCRYHELFKHASTEHLAVGEATAIYLYVPETAKNIQEYVPRAQMFAFLRNPVDRAYSAFLHLRRQGREPIADFLDAVRQEPERIRRNYHPLWHYKSMGLYYLQLKRYLDLFSREQFHVFLYEDLKRDPVAVVQKMLGIMGLDSDYIPDLSGSHNEARLSRNLLRQRWIERAKRGNRALQNYLPAPLRWRANTALEKLESANRMPAPRLSAKMRAALAPEFRDDVLRVQDLVQRDLSGWTMN